MTQSRRSDMSCKSEEEGHWSSLSKRSFLFPAVSPFCALCSWSAIWTYTSCSQTEGCFSVCRRMRNVTFLLWRNILHPCFTVLDSEMIETVISSQQSICQMGEGWKSMLRGINDKCWHSDQPMQAMRSSHPPGSCGYEHEWIRGEGPDWGAKVNRRINRGWGSWKIWAAGIQDLSRAFKSKSSRQGLPCSAWHAKPPFCCADVIDPAVAINSWKQTGCHSMS